jgi:hypothetical protein
VRRIASLRGSKTNPFGGGWQSLRSGRLNFLRAPAISIQNGTLQEQMSRQDASGTRGKTERDPSTATPTRQNATGKSYTREPPLSPPSAGILDDGRGVGTGVEAGARRAVPLREKAGAGSKSEGNGKTPAALH